MNKSSLSQFLKSSQGQQVWIGIDTHKKTYAVALYRRDGMNLKSQLSTPAKVLYAKKTTMRTFFA
ncbi:MAG: hypothetical protein JEY79_12135 [Pseudodesulfovibrio sp.]|nr:hypothetical protein [Pseudodesulfovibrio sp.]